MTSDRRFEHDLPDLLAELAPRAMPDYRDDIVRQTAHMRQRPAWMFPERWLPVSVITTRAFAAPPVRWRVVGVVALLLLALAVGLVVVAGSQRHVPAPFGRAANGVVAYEKGGDIFTADPVTGVAKAVVTGRDDVRPVFSRDGTHFVFERMEYGSERSPDRGPVRRHGPVIVTPEPVNGLEPQGARPPRTPSRQTGRRSHSGRRQAGREALDREGGRERHATSPVAQHSGRCGLSQVSEAAYRPPNGAQLILAGATNGTRTTASTRSTPRPGHQDDRGPRLGRGLGYVRVSPDGSRLA